MMSLKHTFLHRIEIFFQKKSMCRHLLDHAHMLVEKKSEKKIILAELSTIKDFFSSEFVFQIFPPDPTSALIEIDRISQALENQAPFPCREDAPQKTKKKSGSLGTFG